MIFHGRWLFMTMFVFATACTASKQASKQTDKLELARVSFSDLSGWKNDRHEEALATFRLSCPASIRPASVKSAMSIPASTWKKLCHQAGQATSARQFFETYFTPYLISNNGKAEGLFTGYYEPLLEGSLTRQGAFHYPVYAMPPDITTRNPYYTRKEIEAGALAGRNMEIVWVKDPVMLFFMQVQGSGRIRLPDGTEFKASYAGKNNQPYTSIGKYLIENGEMKKEDMNFFTLRQWLYDHPQQAPHVMQQNPSYIFFKRQDKVEVVGAMGVPLTPGRSLAIDKSYIPYGMPLYLQTSLPATSHAPEQPLQRLMVAQDTGSAIASPVRGDIFFGHGADAEYFAGMMQQPGRYYILLPNDVAP